MISAASKISAIFCFASLAVFANAQTTTTVKTVNNTCTVSNNQLNAVSQWMNGYLMNAANVALTLSSYYQSMPTVFSPSHVGFFVNSTALLTLYQTCTKQGMTCGIGFTDSFYSSVTYSTTYQTFVDSNCPASSSTLSYYAVNQNTGIGLSNVPYKTSTFLTTQRPWYTLGINLPAHTSGLTAPYGSVTNSAMQISGVSPIWYQGTVVAVVQTSMYLYSNPTFTPTVNQYLEGINSNPSVVLYVMTSNYVMLVGHANLFLFKPFETYGTVHFCV